MDAVKATLASYREKLKQNSTQSHIQKENEEKSDGLGQAKDRAQLTATSAMSVVQIALLKEVIVLGSKYNSYYMVTVVLISVSLALQIISGLIALLVGHLRGYYSQYEDDALEDCCQHLWCCGVICLCKPSDEDEEEEIPLTTTPVTYGSVSIEEKQKGKVKKEKDKELTVLTDTNVGGKSPRMAIEDIAEHSHVHSLASTETKEDIRFRTGCCPCKLSTMIFDLYEYKILDAYDKWKVQATDFETKFAEMTVELSYLKANVNDARIRLASLTANKESYSEEEFTKRYNEVQQVLDNAKKTRLDLELAERQAVIARARGDVLWEKAKAIRKYQVLKRASFWQNTINYLYYIVFVLNGFITGFGVMSTQYNLPNVSNNSTIAPVATTNASKI